MPVAPSTDVLERAYQELRGDVGRYVARRSPPEAVEDLTQEVFLRMHERAAEVRDTTRLAPWVFRIARSVVVDAHRRRRGSVPLDELSDDLADEADEANLNGEIATWLRPMLAVLPSQYAQALEWTELDGLSQKELAERLGISSSGARSRVQRGRKLLEGVMRACCDFEVDARGNLIGCAVRSRRGAREGDR